MKELSIEEKAKAYDEALKNAREIIRNKDASSVWKDWLCNNFPGLKESEDKKIRKELLEHCKNLAKPYIGNKCPQIQSWISWLEKQDTREEILMDAKKYEAVSIMNFIDKNTHGKFLSNMECKDLDNAVRNDDWQKVYNYMKKKLEEPSEPFDDIFPDDEIVQIYKF